ncbi:hypothetical protein NQ318_017631 [Aromia moschata]|uniref:DUF4817 domain-containing protein n=1 Tax=Aromia moschata TaxID=1265417 RepID=A0AAV8Z277_9CUCU|nr:hypothetical protein NQ318_017631 [Aromia moschata]
MPLNERDRIEILMMIGVGDRMRTQQEVCRLFHEMHPDREPVSQSTVSRIERKYRELGHVRDAPRQGRPKINENVQQDVKYHPYRVRLIHELAEDDFDRRTEFCEYMMDHNNQNNGFIANILFSDEATFFLTGMLIGKTPATGLRKIHTGCKNTIRNIHKRSMCGLVLRELSLQEAFELAYAEDDVDITAIYTEPPEISVLSDEDSCAEDDDGDIIGLSGRQLRAAVEIQQRNNVRINSDTINQGKYYDIDTQEPLVKEKQTNCVWASAPKFEYLLAVSAGHSHNMWKEVSSSSPNLLQSGSFFTPIVVSCRMSGQCPVNSPTRDKSIDLSQDGSPMNIGECLNRGTFAQCALLAVRLKTNNLSAASTRCSFKRVVEGERDTLTRRIQLANNA